MAQQKQIAETAETAQTGISILAGAQPVIMTFFPVGPLGRNERATTVRQAGHHKQNTAPPDAADHRERTALKRVTLAGDPHRIGKIPAMGSLSPLPSTGSITTA